MENQVYKINIKKVIISFCLLIIFWTLLNLLFSEIVSLFMFCYYLVVCSMIFLSFLLILMLSSKRHKGYEDQ